MVIDTSVFIEYLRSAKKINTTLQRLSEEYEWHVSSITIYELFMGANTQKKKLNYMKTKISRKYD